MTKPTKNRSANGTTPETDSAQGYVPFRVDTKSAPVDTERMTLFWIDDREYTGPAQVPANVALRGLELAATVGAEASAWFMLTNSLGEEAVKDLQNCPQVTYDQCRSLFSQIANSYYGQMQDMTSGK